MTMPDRRVRDALSTEANLLRDPIRSIHSERDNRLTPIKGLLAATGVAAVVLLLVGVPILVLRSGMSPNPPTVGAPTTSTTTHVPAASTTTDGSGEVVESSDGDQVGAANDVSPTSKQSLRDASTLRYEHITDSVWSGLIFGEDGSYSWQSTNLDFGCMGYYDPSTNTSTEACPDGEGSAFSVSIRKNIPSSGARSNKMDAIRLAYSPDFGAFEGVNQLPLEESPDGIRPIPLIPHEYTNDSVGSLVADIQTGLVVEAVSVGGDSLSSAVALVLADEDLEHQANIERVETLIAQFEIEGIYEINEVDWGYQQLGSLVDARERVPYQVPVLTLPDTFELSEVFYRATSREHRGIEVVIQIYRDGLREIVVTSLADEYYSDDPERVWDTSPLDVYPVGYPLEESGWSALIHHPHLLPPHFWGISNGAVVTVEGWLVSPAVLENVRQQVITNPEYNNRWEW